MRVRAARLLLPAVLLPAVLLTGDPAGAAEPGTERVGPPVSGLPQPSSPREWGLPSAVAVVLLVGTGAGVVRVVRADRADPGGREDRRW